MSRSEVLIETRDGKSRTWAFRPDTGDAPWPAVLVYMDGRGIRPALFELSERIAAAGYFVLLPDLFYRAGPYDAPDARAFSQDPELRKRWQERYMSSASKGNVLRDTEAYLEYLAQEPAVRSLAIGTTGYCMGGALSLSAAAHFSDRVVAAASYHGGNLATDAQDSPHLLAPRIKARVYVAGAVDDSSFPDEQKRRLVAALQDAGVSHSVETYEGARHGWVPSDSAVYDRAASEQHYRTLLALYDDTLKHAAPKA